MSDQPAAEPVLRIVRGNPSPQDVAALVAVFAALGSAAGPAEPEGRSAWVGTSRRGRRSPRPAPGAWRLSMRSP